MIAAEKANYSVRMMCRALEVSSSAFYHWGSGKEEAATREADRAALVTEIERVHGQSFGIYGSPRVHEQLQREGVIASVNTVARRMKDAGIKGRVRRRCKKTTDSSHSNSVARNHLNRQFDVDIPDSVWCTDITYVRTASGFVYLAVVLDLATKLVVGWSMQRHMETTLVADALRNALAVRKPGANLLHHSDQGTQYTSAEYRRLLKENGIKASMSRKANCWDNAVMESFFGSYKQEWANHHSYDGLVEARLSAQGYIEAFYNRRRLHSSLGYRTPAEVDAEWTRAAA